MIPNTYSNIAVERVYSVGTTGYVEVRIQSVNNQVTPRRFALHALVDGVETRVFTPDIWIDRASVSGLDATIINIEKNKKLTLKFNLLNGTVSNNVYHRTITLLLYDTTDPNNATVAWTSATMTVASKQIDVPTLDIETNETATGYQAVVALHWESNADFSTSIRAFVLRARLFDYGTGMLIEELPVNATPTTTFTFQPYNKGITYMLIIDLEFINGTIAETQEIIWHAKSDRLEVHARYKPAGGVEETRRVEFIYAMINGVIQQIGTVVVKNE